jgi:hypothetical protein
MDNAVELTNSRSRFDSDEVYPVEELRKNKEDDIYQPVARRQNFCFLIGIGFSVMLFFFLFGLPQEDAAIESQGLGEQEQGVVVNNAHNAKVAEAMHNQVHTPGKHKPHASGPWSDKKGKDGQSKGDPVNKEAHPEEEIAAIGNDLATSAPEPADDQPASENIDEPLGTEIPAKDVGIDDNPNTQPPEIHDEKKERNYEAWHSIQVTKNDGVMYEVTEVLKHDPHSFTYVSLLCFVLRESHVFVVTNNARHCFVLGFLLSREGLTYHEGMYHKVRLR